MLRLQHQSKSAVPSPSSSQPSLSIILPRASVKRSRGMPALLRARVPSTGPISVAAVAGLKCILGTGRLLVKAPCPILSRLSPLPSPHRRPSSPPLLTTTSPRWHADYCACDFCFPAAIGFRFTRAHSALTLCRQSAYTVFSESKKRGGVTVASISYAVPCEGPVRARLAYFSGEQRRSVRAHSLIWNPRCSSPQQGSEMPIGSASTRSCPKTRGRAEIGAIDT